jgi:AbiV family abortive infection protein
VKLKNSSSKSTKKYCIPLHDLPNGIFLCLDNSYRHRKDAEILVEKGRYNSAIVSLYIAIEEFTKALWFVAHLVRTKDIDEKEGKHFTDHRYKLDQFFKYVDKIEGYKRSTGSNLFVKMAEKISDEQEFKLRMLYVDYDGPLQKRTYWNYYDWWDPNYIWQISWVDDYDSNLPLSTRYEELKKDLEAAVTHFRGSELYKILWKNRPPPTPNIHSVITFVDNHFQLKNGTSQISGQANPKSIELQITPLKSQDWIDTSLLKIIEDDLKKFYKVNDVKVEFFLK